MSDRIVKARQVAVVLLITALILFVAGVVGSIAISGVDRGNDDTLWVALMFSAVNLAFALSGYVIAVRSGNRLGWLLLGLAVLVNLGGAADSYAAYALYMATDAPGGLAAAWVADFVISGAGLLFGTFIFVFLLFPHGRLPEGRWRLLAYVGGAGAFLAQLDVAFSPGPLPGFPEIHNPLGSRAAEGLLERAEFVSMIVILVALIGSIASMVSRYRRSGSRERQQMKWVGAAGGFLVLIIASGPIWWIAAPSVGEAIWPALFATGLAGIPTSIAISILKYRLYDIDVVINKTLVYVSLTVVLAACYLGSIVLLQSLLPVAGDSDLAIAASTLAVAALFQPLRVRIQGFIDRRFYRRKYDAAQTLQEFSAHLRDQVDLDSLNHELFAVVARTMGPSHASLWLREGAAG